MDREFSTGTIFAESSDFYEFASEFDNPVVQRYAHVLRDAQVTLASFERPTITEELIRANIPEVAAGDIVDALRKYLRRGVVGVYWDLENIGLPQHVSPLTALSALRDVIISRFGQIEEFKAYADLSVFARTYDPATRVMFRDCGIELVDATHNQRKEVADKHIIVDALWFALQTTNNPVVCLITGDSDFSPLLAKLKLKGITTVLITVPTHVRSLRQQATYALSWPGDFIRGASTVIAGEQRNRPEGGRGLHASAGSVVPPPPPPPPYNDTRATTTTTTTTTTGAATHTTNPTPQTPASTKSSAPASIEQPEGSESADDTIVYKSAAQQTLADLVECIKSAQADSGATKVKRSVVGIKFKKLNPVVAFSQVVSDAIAVGRVVVGGLLGFAWIALREDVTDEEANASSSSTTSLQAASSPTNGTKGGGAAPDSNLPWWVTLRYNSSFNTFGFMNGFRPAPPLVSKRVVEPNGMWYRTAVGPFESIAEADDYYTMHFGDLRLLPKIVQRVDQYVSPSVGRVL